MKRPYEILIRCLSVLISCGMVLSAVQPALALQAPAQPVAPQTGKNIRYGYNSRTGKLSFIGADPSAPIAVSGAQALKAGSPAAGIALISPYAHQFGLNDPSSDLRFTKSSTSNGRTVTRYQQIYYGIPVMAGEMIVNADKQNRLISLSGKIASGLNLSAQPTILAASAQKTALQAVAKWYHLTPSDLKTSDPSVWIYDPLLFDQENQPATLVWRMDVLPVTPDQPVDELVLVDAQTGKIDLHFSQVDNAFAEGVSTGPSDLQVEGTLTDTPVASPSDTSVPTASASDTLASTDTFAPGGTMTSTPVPTDTFAPSATSTSILAPTGTPSPTATNPIPPTDTSGPTATAASSFTPTATSGPTATASPTLLTTATATSTALPTGTPTNTLVPSETPWGTPGATPTKGPARPAYLGFEGLGSLSTVYVSPAGSDSNSCDSPAAPCRTIGAAIVLASNGATIEITADTYSDAMDTYSMILVDQVNDLRFEGGYDSGFANQIGATTLDAKSARRVFANVGETVTLDHMTFIHGRSPNKMDGGGIWNSGTLTLDNSTVENNTSLNATGGGIYNDGTIIVDHVAILNNIVNGSVINNTGNGAGILNTGSATILNTTISGNEADSFGGGIYQTGTGVNLTLNNVTISQNSALQGGGLNVYQGSADIANSILAWNTSSTLSGPDCLSTATLTSRGYNLVEDNSTGGCAFSATGDQTGIDPKIGALTGSPSYYLLGYASPAADAGNPAAPNGYQHSFACEPTDQIGTIRPVAGMTSAVCDIGAFETQPLSSPYAKTITLLNGSNQSEPIQQPFPVQLSVLVKDQYGVPYDNATVTFTAPGSGASGSFADSANNVTTAMTGPNGIATAAVFTANGTGGAYQVTAAVSGVAGMVYFILQNRWPYYVIMTAPDDSRDCRSPANACKTIDGAIRKAGEGDIVEVAVGTYTGSGTSPVMTVNVNNLTVSGGWDVSFKQQNGFTIVDGQQTRQGLSVPSGITAEVNHFEIQNGSGSGNGGGITNDGTLLLDDSSVSASSATSGGGISNTGTLTLNNSSVSDSSAVNGGGIYQAGISLALKNSTISGNTASNDGGAVYGQSGMLNLNNATISDNTALTGGGIYQNGGWVDLQNSILADNTANASGGDPDCAVIEQNASSAYSLIGDLSAGCQFASNAGDLPPQDPQLGSLVGEPAYQPLLSSSPVIDQGNPNPPGENGACLASDERGVPRPQGMACDMGAYEYTPPGAASQLEVMAGNNQRALPSTPFLHPLEVVVLDDLGSPVEGVNVTFTAPADGPTGTFAEGASTTAVTGPDGVAASDTFTANATQGSYTVDVTADGVTGSVQFNLANVEGYVATTGNDASSCFFPTEPCATIDAAIAKAFPGEIISIAAGTYTGSGNIPVVTIDRDLELSGGWNASFMSQTGLSTIDGQKSRRGIVIDSAPTVTLERLVVQNATAYNGGSGIDLASGGSLTLTKTFLQDNTILDPSSLGGAIYLAHSGTLILNAGAVRSNSSRGIYNAAGTVTLNASSVTGNAGTGIFHVAGTVNLNNTTISDNSDGGIRASDMLNLVNTTIADNHSKTNGGGIEQNTGTATLTSSILAGNTAAGSDPDCAGTLVSGGYALIGDISAGCTFTSAGNDITNQDPELGPLVGSPAYRPLILGSPAIDAGPDSVGSACLDKDERGIDRPQAAACDLGAYEYTTPGPASQMIVLAGDNQGVLPLYSLAVPLQVVVLDSQGSPVSGVVVTFTAPASGASGTFAGTKTDTTTSTTGLDGVATADTFTANGTLGSYTVTAAASGTGSVQFHLSNFSGYVSPSGDDGNSCTSPTDPCQTIDGAISKSVAWETIYIAAGSYTGDGTDRVVNIDRSLVLSGGWNASFTVQNGMSTIDGEKSRPGVYITPGNTVTMERISIQNGVDTGTGGGGLYLSSSTLTLNDATLSGNTTSSNGGGIYNDHGDLTLNNVTINGNSAANGGGGGLYTDHGSVTIHDATISDNFATQSYTDSHTTIDAGGGVYNGGGSISIQNSILARNSGLPQGSDCFGTITSTGYNLIGSNADCTIVSGTGDQIGSGTHPIEASLGTLTNLGGFLVQPLQASSPAINAGSPAVPGSGGNACLATDEVGATRPAGACDLGAYQGSGGSTPAATVRVYNAYHTATLPGALVCDQGRAGCTGGADPQADALQAYAEDTYNFFLNHFNRDSLDGAGMALIGTIHYRVNYDNSFWNGAQAIFGDKHAYPLADDVVAHEFAHGLNDHTAQLDYYYQSGAIDESLSDMWGEFVDQTNGKGNDSYLVKWLIGEDVTGLPGGAIANMKNPPQFGDPDKMTSSYYDFDPNFVDNGGVHANSGINNKAVFLMTDGGTFNGETVAPLGLNKVAAIYYEVETHLLTSGSDYSDLYYALYQSCMNLVGGPEGISAADCQQVRNATDAVEMNLQPKANFNPDADLCPAGMTTSAAPNVTLFQDDMESGSGNWAFSPSGSINWSLEQGFASSGTHSLWGDDSAPSSASYAQMAAGISLPPGSSPYLYFNHAFDFETNQNTYYDGGMLQYSTDGGATWKDAGSLFSTGKNYGGTLHSGTGNPMGGHSAFVGSSHGYVASRYNLTSLAGKTVVFRWLLATDSSIAVMGWYVDDIKIYVCQTAPSIPAQTAPASNSLVTTYTPLLDWNNSSPTPDHYEVQVATDNLFTSSSLLIDQNTGTSSSYQLTSALASNSTYYWRVIAYNAIGGTLGWSAVWSFRTVLPQPVLLTPADSIILPSNLPAFTWNPISGVTGYTIQISKNSTFTQLLTNLGVTPASYTPTSAFAVAQTLYWRVQAKGANGPSAWSPTRQFITANPPSTPTLVSPPTNSLSTSTTYTPTLSWSLVTLPKGTTFGRYELQLSTSGSFSNPIDHTDLTTLSTHQYTLTPADGLTPNTTYSWRVRAVNASGSYSPWSLVWTFRTLIQPPVLITPPNANTLPSNRPAFTWTPVSGANGYTIQISKNSAFTSLVTNLSVTSASYTPTTDLPANLPLFWRVQTKATNGPSGWSAPWQLTTANPPSVPTLSSPANTSLSSSTSYTPTFIWSQVTLPKGTAFGHYELQVAASSSFSNPIDHTDLTVLSTHQYTLSSGEALAPNTTYYWRVRAATTSGSISSWSAVWFFRTLLQQPALWTPPNPDVLNYNRPTFTWNPVNGATSYAIQISRNSGFTSLVTNLTVTPASYTPTADLPAALPLFWRVQAKGTNGPSAWSAPSQLTTANPPSVPTLSSPGNNALTSSYQQRFDWSTSSLPLTTTFDHYELQISVSSSFGGTPFSKIISNGISSSEYTLTSGEALTPNTIYYWRVRSANTNGDISSWSSVWTLRALIHQPTSLLPANPSVLNYNRPTFTWSSIPYATGYTIQISKNSAFTSLVTNTTVISPSYTPSAYLPAALPLYWRVQTRGAIGPSVWSAVSQLTTANPPSVPTPASPANNSLATSLTPTFSWSLVTLPAGTTFGHYQLQVSPSNTFMLPVVDRTDLSVLSTHQYTLSSTEALIPNSTYYWRVRSLNQAGDYGSWSTVWTVRTPNYAPSLISPCLIFTTTLRPTLTWTAVNGATSYTFQIAKNSTFTQLITTLSTTSTSYTPTSDLPANTSLTVPIRLYWRVQTKSALGLSAWASTWFYPANPPSIPSLSSPANNGLSPSITFTPTLIWAAATLPPGTTFDHYELQVSPSSTFNPPLLDHTDLSVLATHQYTLSSDEALVPNSTYYWRVQAADQDQNGSLDTSSWSPIWSFRTLIQQPSPITPANNAILNNNRPSFTWIQDPGASAYTLQVARDLAFTKLVINTSVTTTSYTPSSDLPANLLLYWRLQATGTNGPSAWSPIWQFQSANPPSIPNLASPANNSLSLSYTYTPTLTWSTVTLPGGTSFDHYELQVSTVNNFATSIDHTDLTALSTPQYTLTSLDGLVANTTYYWRVRSANTNGDTSTWSAVWSFRTVISQPVLLTPADGTWTSNREPTFDWSDVAGASSYTLQVSPDAIFDLLTLSATTATSTYTATGNLTVGTYYWRVQASGTNGPSLWSTTYSFVEQ